MRGIKARRGGGLGSRMKEDNSISMKNVELGTESFSDEEHALPDGGFGWVVVGCSFMVSFIVYGLIYTFNFFTEHYQEMPQYANQKEELVFIGTVNLAVLNMSCLVMGRVDDRFGHRKCIVAGTLVYSLGLALSAFATELWQLILTQGVMLGLSGGLVCIATISAPMQWFDKRRGLASGIAMAGCGVGSLLMAIVIPQLLKVFSVKHVLLGFAAFSCVTMLTAAFVIRDQPKVLCEDDVAWYDCSIMKKPMFLLILAGNTLATFGYILPSYIMKDYVKALGLNPDTSSPILSMVCAAASISRVIGGILADKYGSNNMLILCLLIMCGSCSILWIFSYSFGMLMFFGFLFGLGMGGFVSLPPMITSKLFGVKGLSTINGWLYFMAGFPALFGVPLARKIINLSTENIQEPTAHFFYGIQYAGLTALGGAIIILILKLKIDRNLFARV